MSLYKKDNMVDDNLISIFDNSLNYLIIGNIIYGIVVLHLKFLNKYVCKP